MRIFIAIELPEEIKSYLKQIQKNITGIKGSFTKDFHLTLKFLGEVDKESLEKLKENLIKIKFTPFKLKLSSLGFFPNESYIRVLWIGVEPEDSIKKLQKEVERSLSKFNFKRDFNFKPHLTLARVKYIENKSEFVEKLKELKIKSLDFEVTRFYLIKSTLTEQGPVYERLAEF